jgi:hypothetical protein
MNRPGLFSHSGELRQIGDRLSACIHIAPTARCQPDSRLVERLKNAERADPQRHKQREAPAPGRSDYQE